MANTDSGIVPLVKEIGYGGAGGEASVVIQLRNIFPGVGGEISSHQSVVTAFRKPLSPHQSSEAEMVLFLKHVILKKLDDYFTRTGRYHFPHITRPLGSTTDKKTSQRGYFYEWVMGKDAFPWYEPQPDGEMVDVRLEEWQEFTSAFIKAGIGVESDITDVDNSRISKNIVHQIYQTTGCPLNLCWKRIDFGSNSLPIRWEQLRSFLERERGQLIEVLTLDRYELMCLAYRFIYERNEITERECGQLDMLARAYRMSSLRHKLSEHIMR